MVESGPRGVATYAGYGGGQFASTRAGPVGLGGSECFFDEVDGGADEVL